MALWVMLLRVTSVGKLRAARGPRKSFVLICDINKIYCRIKNMSMIETLRREGIRIPVLVVSALASVDERIRGLKAGGDDYLIKPFAMGELAARIEALLRRSNDSRTTVLQVGPLRIDLIERSAMRRKRILDLLPTEFKLLEYLMRRPGQVITRTMFLEDVWHYRNMPQTNLVDVHIGKLRRKLDMAGDPQLIHSVRRSGFMLHVGD